MGLSHLKIKFKKQINMGTWNVVLWVNMQITHVYYCAHTCVNHKELLPANIHWKCSHDQRFWQLNCLFFLGFPFSVFIFIFSHFFDRVRLSLEGTVTTLLRNEH